MPVFNKKNTMRLYKLYIFPLFILAAVVIFLQASSCNGKLPEPVPPAGKIMFSFKHVVDDVPIVFDTMIYQNAAKNPYLVNEIQYFISDITVWKNGQSLLLDNWEDIHYVDTDIPNTWHFNPEDDIPEGEYDSITFTFGINKEKNQSFMFVNPPESFMFWPEYLGGGYHYMKLNGKWLDTSNVVRPFNFHMGIGQIYDEQSNITGFIQNYFTVHLSGSSFKMETGKTVRAVITMHVEEWFEDPNIFDFNYWGGDIMEKQPAMQEAKENGHNVFSISFE